MPMAPTIAHGTAVAALLASSLIWTLESKEPVALSASICLRERLDLHIVHRGERKLRMKANPLAYPFAKQKYECDDD